MGRVGAIRALIALHAPVYEHVAQQVGSLGLPGVHVEDRLFVNGADLRYGIDDRTRREVLPAPDGPPRPEVSAELLRELREDGKGRARSYLAVPVLGWSGELVSTLFLRFALLPGHDILFVEASTSLMAPVREAYRKVDSLLSRPTFRQLTELAGQAIPRTFGLLIRSVPSVLSALAGPLNARAKRRQQAREIRHLTFNYGAPFCIREEAADKRYHRYFQSTDREMYTKTIEHRVLDSLADFMDAHHIDTYDLIQRQTAIYNTGIYAGGNVNIKESAVNTGRGFANVANMVRGRTGGGGQGLARPASPQR